MQPKNETRPLDALLYQAKMTQADLSRTFDMTPAAISRWHKIGIPQYAVAYLELRAELIALRQQIEQMQKSPRD